MLEGACHCGSVRWSFEGTPDSATICAKINTEGERVVDVFYVSTPGGHKVLDGEELGRIREALRAAVRQLKARMLGPGIVSTVGSGV